MALEQDDKSLHVTLGASCAPLKRSFQSLKQENHQQNDTFKRTKYYHHDAKSVPGLPLNDSIESLAKLHSVMRSASGRELREIRSCGSLKKADSIKDLVLNAKFPMEKSMQNTAFPLRKKNPSPPKSLFQCEPRQLKKENDRSPLISDQKQRLSAPFGHQLRQVTKATVTGCAIKSNSRSKSEEIKKEAEIYCCIGSAWKEWGNQKKAIENYDKAILAWTGAKALFSGDKAELEMADIHIAGIYSVVENIYSELGNFEKSRKIHEAALSLLGDVDEKLSSASEIHYSDERCKAEVQCNGGCAA